jgi:hypothetical protein
MKRQGLHGSLTARLWAYFTAYRTSRVLRHTEARDTWGETIPPRAPPGSPGEREQDTEGRET